MAEEVDNTAEDEEPDIPTLRKVGIVMVALGEEVSGEVLKHLGGLGPSSRYPDAFPRAFAK